MDYGNLLDDALTYTKKIGLAHAGQVPDAGILRENFTESFRRFQDRCQRVQLRNVHQCIHFIIWGKHRVPSRNERGAVTDDRSQYAFMGQVEISYWQELKRHRQRAEYG